MVPPAWEVPDPAGPQRTAGRRRAKTVGIAIWAVVAIGLVALLGVLGARNPDETSGEDRPEPDRQVSTTDPTPSAPVRSTVAQPPVTTTRPAPVTTTATTTATPPATSPPTVALTDSTLRLSVEVPSSWGQIQPAMRDIGAGVFVPSLVATTDLFSFENAFSVPGAALLIFDGFGSESVDETLDGFLTPRCTFIGRSAYDDGLYSGGLDQYVDCDGIGTDVWVVAATPAENTFIVVALVKLTADADRSIVDLVFDSFIAN